MVKKLLGLVCSPRKYGNSELFIKELYRQLPGVWELSLVRLPELDIRPCKACYQCLFGELRCHQNDDFGIVLEALAMADAYAVAAPTYFLGPNASLKGFLDRGLAFYAQLERLWSKPAVGVVIAGIEGMEGYSKLAVESFVRLTFGELRGFAVLYGALPGEIFLDNSGKATAGRLARALVEGKEQADPMIPSCPVCGGESFRFLGDGQLRCLLCSNPGRYQSRDQGIEIHVTAGEHSLFLTREDAERHAQWLRGMKDKFLARRKELKALTQHYVQTGNWIRGTKSGTVDQESSSL